MRYRAVALIEESKFFDALNVLDELVELSGHTSDYGWRALVLTIACLHRAALSDCQIILQRLPDNRSAIFNSALIRATSPDSKVRDGRLAIDLASRLIKSPEPPSWQQLSVLAAAYAEYGDFDAAEMYAVQTLSLAPVEFHKRFKDRIQQYRERIPYRCSFESNVESWNLREKVKCETCGEAACTSSRNKTGTVSFKCLQCAGYDVDKPDRENGGITS